MGRPGRVDVGGGLSGVGAHSVNSDAGGAEACCDGQVSTRCVEDVSGLVRSGLAPWAGAQRQAVGMIVYEEVN